MIRVRIRALSPLSRKGLEQMLAPEPGFALLSESPEGGTSSGNLGYFPPDVSVVEYDGDEEAGTELGIEEFEENIPTVLLVDRPTTAWISNAIRSGAKGIVPRGISRERLVAAIYAVATGLVVLHPDEVHTALLARGSGLSRDTAVESITPRENEVLMRIADGLSNKEIADRLSISEHTVKFHVASIMSKLGASSRTEAVTAAIRHGLLLI